MAAPNRKAVFDFFSLSRELRDLIYVELLIDSPAAKLYQDGEDVTLTMYATDAAATSLLLVNHQFSVEYREQERLAKTLVLWDTLIDDGLYSDKPTILHTIPTRFAACLRVTANLYLPNSSRPLPAQWNHVERDVVHHAELLNELIPGQFKSPAVIGDLRLDVYLIEFYNPVRADGSYTSREGPVMRIGPPPL
ncbi:hypothetical protein BAUCODRAFT_149087 [Baudoinia panamericana UAMH 10762]|uniref:Uncharacterized protein n=1 Tax=Baudoinia panamericana (strain UAMH 10762) TaxID=717646 RepID=M2N7M0_BAUPA|nr:uncharacterized protein BAUCODRAFT_149087 [Baudoinia panamericana UAMH 10762]EMC95059.1 hypothetical protein BAUCODRAFT_149087 [Baudoinia panamericana UAMH 10762]